MKIQDRVFIGGPYVDPIYQQRRERALVIAVNCTQAASTCFCTSMNTGPRCTSGFDLALTELPDGFVIESATPEGQAIVDQLTTQIATEEKLKRRRNRTTTSRRSNHQTNGHDQISATC